MGMVSHPSASSFFSGQLSGHWIILLIYICLHQEIKVKGSMHHVPQRQRKETEQDQEAKKVGHMYGDVIEYTHTLAGLLLCIARLLTCLEVASWKILWRNQTLVPLVYLHLWINGISFSFKWNPIKPNVRNNSCMLTLLAWCCFSCGIMDCSMIKPTYYLFLHRSNLQ